MVAVGMKQEEAEFKAARAPPFRLAEIRAAIPKHCWEKDRWRSLSYVARDVAVVVALAAVAAWLDSWAVWPVYGLAQGTMFWALFVLGHDCGHGSFSDDARLNSAVGHFLHSMILVPYHGWRISHRTHHQNHGHVEKDETWHPIGHPAPVGVPANGRLWVDDYRKEKWRGFELIGLPLFFRLIPWLPEKTYKSLDSLTRKMRFTIPFPMFAWPIYLWTRSPGKSGSHFNPYSGLFLQNERTDVATSTFCCASMFALLLLTSWAIGPVLVLKLYLAPYCIFVMWLDFVTYLHHHGHSEKLPWYRGKEWSYLRGALTTLDRDYGWINKIHHDIGTHVIHHLFPQIPHYHLVEATKAARPVLGKYYRDPERSGPLPLHLFVVIARSLRVDHFVSDIGDVVFYQTDPDQLNGGWRDHKLK